MREVDTVRGKLQCLHCNLASGQTTIRNLRGKNASVAGFPDQEGLGMIVADIGSLCVRLTFLRRSQGV